MYIRRGIKTAGKMKACKTFNGENMYLTGLEARNIILKRTDIF
jgi:hypothetical protein